MGFVKLIVIIGVSLLLDSAVAVESCICYDVYQPICGTDGITYGNQCELDCATERNDCITKFADGSCQAECVCPLYISYICGTDGVTYDNLCQLECAARKTHNSCLTIAYDEQCQSF